MGSAGPWQEGRNKAIAPYGLKQELGQSLISTANDAKAEQPADGEDGEDGVDGR